MSTITTKDGTEIYYKDWGEGPVVTFTHGWPLSADAWDGQMLFLAQHGYRAVAHDRRGHGRSSQAIIRERHGRLRRRPGRRDRGARPARRHAGRPLHRRRRSRPLHRPPRHQPGRQGGAASPPSRRSCSRSAANPEGLPMEVFDGLRAGLYKDRSQFYKDLAIQFYGANRPGAKVSQGVLDQFWLWSMQSGLKNAYECIKAFSETDFTEDLAEVRRPDPGPARRGRPDRPRPGLGQEVGPAHHRRAGDLLPGRAARPDRHPPGPVQRRPARLPAQLATART